MKKKYMFSLIPECWAQIMNLNYGKKGYNSYKILLYSKNSNHLHEDGGSISSLLHITISNSKQGEIQLIRRKILVFSV